MPMQLLFIDQPLLPSINGSYVTQRIIRSYTVESHYFLVLRFKYYQIAVLFLYCRHSHSTKYGCHRMVHISVGTLLQAAHMNQQQKLYSIDLAMHWSEKCFYPANFKQANDCDQPESALCNIFGAQSKKRYVMSWYEFGSSNKTATPPESSLQHFNTYYYEICRGQKARNRINHCNWWKQSNMRIQQRKSGINTGTDCLLFYFNLICATFH